MRIIYFEALVYHWSKKIIIIYAGKICASIYGDSEIFCHFVAFVIIVTNVLLRVHMREGCKTVYGK
jgi:hypothetical protein